MMDNFRFQVPIQAADRIRGAQVRNGTIGESGRRIFRIGRETKATRPLGRR